jgi:hypothetical protein
MTFDNKKKPHINGSRPKEVMKSDNFVSGLKRSNKRNRLNRFNYSEGKNPSVVADKKEKLLLRPNKRNKPEERELTTRDITTATAPKIEPGERRIIYTNTGNIYT